MAKITTLHEKHVEEVPAPQLIGALDGNAPSEVEVLRQEIARLTERIAILESKAHTDHALGPEAVNAIIGMAVEKINEHLRARFAVSGLPVRGDNT